MTNYLNISQQVSSLKLDRAGKSILLGLALSQALPAHPDSGDTATLKLYFARVYQTPVSKFLSTLNELEYVDITATLNIIIEMWSASSIAAASRQFTYALYNPYIREVMLKSSEMGFYDADRHVLNDAKNAVRWAMEEVLKENDSVSAVDAGDHEFR